LVSLHALGTAQAVRKSVIAKIAIAHSAQPDFVPANAQHVARRCDPKPPITILGQSEYLCPKLRGKTRGNMKAGTSLIGDLPLIVLTRGIPDGTGPNTKSLEEDHRKDHEILASISRKGKLIVAEHSGHHIQLQEPELVAASIRQVLAAK
jgi:hypothetical protein